MCQELASHPSKRYYPNASIPPLLDLPGLFNPDANSPMWMDASLNDNDETHVPPAYLADPKVQEGILGWLQLERCKEEEFRVLREMNGLIQWVAQRINAIKHALCFCQGLPSLHYLLSHASLINLFHRPCSLFSTNYPASNRADHWNEMDARSKCHH